MEVLIGEDIGAWLQRCVPAKIAEGETYEQATQSCTLIHENTAKITNPELRTESVEPPNNPVININIGKFKLETKEIKGVEILMTGKYKGKEYTEKDLDQFIENFENKIAEPVLTIDHDETLTEKVKNEFKVMALGYVEKLKRVGNKLFADFKQVPKVIAELIEAGPLKQRSVEFFKTFKTSGGKSIDNVLTGVTFFGAGLPAVAGMSDMMQFFKTEPDGLSDKQCDDEKESLLIESMESIKFKEAVMPIKDAPVEGENVSIPKAEYDALLAIKAEYEDMKKVASVELVAKKTPVAEDVSKLKDTENLLETFKNEVAELKVKLEETSKVAAEYETFKTEQLKAEAESYIGSQIEAKKLLPKFKDMKIADYIRLKADAPALELFKLEIEQREVVVPENFKDVTVNASDKEQFKTIEDVGPAYDKLISQGKTNAEALELLGVK